MKRLILSILFFSMCGVSISAARVKNEVVREIEHDIFTKTILADYSWHQKLDSCISSGSLNRYDALRARIHLQLCYDRIHHYCFSVDTLAYYSSKLNKSDSLFLKAECALFEHYIDSKQYALALPLGKHIEPHAKYHTFDFLQDMASIQEAIGDSILAAEYYWKGLQKSASIADTLLGRWSLKYSYAQTVVECYQKYHFDTTDYCYRFADSIYISKPKSTSTLSPTSPYALNNILWGKTFADTLGYYSNKSYFPPYITIELAKTAVAHTYSKTAKKYTFLLESNRFTLFDRIGNAYIQTHQIDSALLYFQLACDAIEPISLSEPDKYFRALVNLANIQVDAGRMEDAEKSIARTRKLFRDYWGVTDYNMRHYLERQKNGDLNGFFGLPSPVAYLLICERFYITRGELDSVKLYSDLLQTLPLSFEQSYYHQNTMAYLAQHKSEFDELYNIHSTCLTDFRNHYFATYTHTYKTRYGLTFGYSSADREQNLSRLSLIGRNALMYAAHNGELRLSRLVYDYALFYKQLLLESDKHLYRPETDSARVLLSQRRNLLKLRQYATMWQRDFVQKKIDDIERKLLAMQSDSTITESIATSEQLRTCLPSDVACIEFMRYEDYVDWQPTGHTYYVALLLRANDSLPKLIPLCEEYELQTHLLDKTSSIAQYYRSDILQQCIWEPLRPYLNGISTIYFTGDGALHHIALEASKLSPTDYATSRFNLIRLTSTKEAIALSKSDALADRNDQAALFGNIDYGSVSAEYAATRAFRNVLDPLSYSDMELAGINKILENQHVPCNIYSQKNGSEESVMQLDGQSPSVLHFSTHGFSFTNNEALETPYYQQRGLVYVDPMERSGLFFADAANALSGVIPQNGEDGILTAAEIATLDLSGTELVVLSACETALGDITSEGVWGLQRAFKLAGVRTIVMSLWQVDDEATAVLMQYFYEELFRLPRQQFSPHIALTTAQHRMRQHPKFSSPYYWAAFIAVD